MLLRLQHLFGCGEDATLAQPAQLSLEALFAFLRLPVQTVREVSLTANQPRSDMVARRMRWNGRGGQSEAQSEPTPNAVVQLTCLQIRTFMLQLGSP